MIQLLLSVCILVRASYALNCMTCSSTAGREENCNNAGQEISCPSVLHICRAKVFCDNSDVLTWEKSCFDRRSVTQQNTIFCNSAGDECHIDCETQRCNGNVTNDLWQNLPCVDDEGLVEINIEDKAIDFNIRDAEAFANRYTLAAIVYPPFAAPVRGRDAIKNRFVALNGTQGLKTNILKRDYRDLGNDFFTEATCYQRTNDDGTHRGYGESLHMFQKVDGKALVFRHIFTRGDPTGSCGNMTGQPGN